MNQATTEQKATEAEINQNVVNFRWLRKRNRPYVVMWVIYYAWVISFATWWTASPLTKNVFSTELRSLLHTVNLVSSSIFMFTIQKEWFVKTARIGAVLVITGVGLFLIAPNAQIQLLCAIIIGMALGCVNTSILMPFVFALNNTEKLYAVVSSNVLISLISLFQAGNGGRYLQGGGDLLLSSIMLAVAFSTTLFFKKDSLPNVSDALDIDAPTFHPRIYLTLFLNCVFAILCKGVGTGILNISALNSGYPVLIWHYLGGLSGCFTYLAVYALAKKSIVWLGNLAFGSFAMGLFCNAFAVQIPGLAVAFAFLLGIGSTVGMINMYYIIGVVGKKYNSMRYLRLSILFIGICGGVSGVALGSFIHSTNTFEISMITSIFSAAVTLLLIMLSPIMSQSRYYNDWARDSEIMEIDNEQLYLFRRYGLSKREIEVSKLLLQGYTMRQISGILSIAYSIVNTYCTSIYRKTDINSRTELLKVFEDYTNK